MTVLDMNGVQDIDGLLDALSKTEQNFEDLAATASKFGAKYISQSFDKITPQGLVKMLGIKGIESKYTETETRDSAVSGMLAEDAKAGATTLKVKNAVRWPKNNSAVAFNAGPLPNRELADYTAVAKEGTVWVVTLKKPLAKDYKAGTKVWVQSPGAHFSIANVKQPTDEWQKFEAVTKGVGINKVENGKFWPGTAYAEPMLMANWYWGAGCQDQKIQLRNIKVEKVSK
jgi:hypothetical protein